LSTPFQNRLVGSIIIAAAIIIFLPDMLDGKKKSNQAEFEAIPQVPVFTGKTNKKTFPEQSFEKKEAEVFDEQAKDFQLSVKNQAVQNKNKTKVTSVTTAKTITVSKQKIANTSIKKPPLGKQPAKAVNKEAWVIQLGSFRHKANVNELLAKLKRNGYTAFTKPIKTQKGTLIKVFVGPELIKSSLIKKLPALKKLTNVQGRVAQFYPTK